MILKGFIAGEYTYCKKERVVFNALEEYNIAKRKYKLV